MILTREGSLVSPSIPGQRFAGASPGGPGAHRFRDRAAKIRSAPPQLGSPRMVMSKHIPEVIEPGRRLLRALGYSGFSCTEFKWDARDQSYKLMEVNGRHNVSSRLAASCGMDFPHMEYRHVAYGEKPSPCDFEDGSYWIDLGRDVVHTARHWRLAEHRDGGRRRGPRDGGERDQSEQQPRERGQHR